MNKEDIILGIIFIGFFSYFIYANMQPTIFTISEPIIVEIIPSSSNSPLEVDNNLQMYCRIQDGYRICHIRNNSKGG